MPNPARWRVTTFNVRLHGMMLCPSCPAQAAYLAKAGKSVAVLERRHVLGGAAVTEEIIPGFKFSRASYLLSLLRPQIVKDLELKVQLI